MSAYLSSALKRLDKIFNTEIYVMGSKLVSIIIPVYNTEKYLAKCLDSVIAQTYTNIEVVLIDDGSTDGSPAICDSYHNKDERVIVYHRENQGASLARKFGLSVAKGQFIQFVDSDDWIKPEMTEKLVRSAEENNSDIAWCDVEMVEKEGTRDFKIKYNSSSTEMLRSLYWGRISGWFVNKIIRADLLADITFPASWMMEDVFLTTQLLLKQAKNSYVPESLYCYNRLNENAVTSKANGNEILIKAMPNIENCYQFLKKYNVFERYEEDFSCLAMRLKIAILKTKGIVEAKSVYGFAHKHLKSYGLQPPVAYIYWLGFNFGKFGEFLLNLYLKKK
ncbi:MAG: glycosyltransferase [Paludibacteraceae bacterium]|nr:glycosyltransferase [Paludibacteraceae bacterium]MBR6043528.1 glycosyltransferase [Paludibacteraceae bacterium]